MHFCCKSKFFEGQNYFGGMKCSKVEGEWSPFWESYNFWGEINHFYGAIFTLCWPLNTLLNPPKNLGSDLTPPFLLGCMVLVLGHGSKSFVKWEIITDVVTSDKASHQIMSASPT